MKLPSLNGRTLALVGVLGTLLALFIYVALRSGPLAPVPVTVAAAEISRCCRVTSKTFARPPRRCSRSIVEMWRADRDIVWCAGT